MLSFYTQGGVILKIANSYNHLNAREYLIVNKNEQYAEICDCISSVNANDFLKISCDKANLGLVFYNQGKINSAIKEKLNNYNWRQRRVDYYVTGDEPTTREIVYVLDKEEQRQILYAKGLESYATYNQVDF